MIKKFKVGTVQTKKDNSGVTVRVGNPISKNPKYVLNVKLTVTDGEGNVVAEATNGYLQVLDPRLDPNKTEEQIAQIPAYVKQELFVIVDN